MLWQHTQWIETRKRKYRIPTLEFALAMKFAAMVSPNRRPIKKRQDGVDFGNMVLANPVIDLKKLANLGAARLPGRLRRDCLNGSPSSPRKDSNSEPIHFPSIRESNTRTFFQLDRFSSTNCLCRSDAEYLSRSALVLNTKCRATSHSRSLNMLFSPASVPAA